MRLTLMITKLEGLSLYEEHAFSAFLFLGTEVSEVKLLAKSKEYQLIISGIQSGIYGCKCDE